jgi:hypothetical protein
MIEGSGSVRPKTYGSYGFRSATLPGTPVEKVAKKVYETKTIDLNKITDI